MLPKNNSFRRVPRQPVGEWLAEIRDPLLPIKRRLYVGGKPLKLPLLNEDARLWGYPLTDGHYWNEKVSLLARARGQTYCLVCYWASTPGSGIGPGVLLRLEDHAGKVQPVVVASFRELTEVGPEGQSNSVSSVYPCLATTAKGDLIVACRRKLLDFGTKTFYKNPDPDWLLAR